MGVQQTKHRFEYCIQDRRMAQSVEGIYTNTASRTLMHGEGIVARVEPVLYFLVRDTFFCFCCAGNNAAPTTCRTT